MFEGAAQAALDLYCTTFPHAVAYARMDAPFQVELVLEGHSIILADSPAKHAFTFTPSASLFVTFDDAAAQEAVYKSFSDGGQILMPLDTYGFSQRFGWVSDRFGVSWQLNLP